MNLSDLRDATDVSLPDVSMPDVSLPDVLDIDVVDLAGEAIELAGDVAGAVVTQSSRGLVRAIRSARRNPKAAVGVVAIVVLLVGLLAAKRRTAEPSLESIS